MGLAATFYPYFWGFFTPPVRVGTNWGVAASSLEVLVGGGGGSLSVQMNV